MYLGPKNFIVKFVNRSIVTSNAVPVAIDRNAFRTSQTIAICRQARADSHASEKRAASTASTPSANKRLNSTSKTLNGFLALTVHYTLADLLCLLYSIAAYWNSLENKSRP